MSENSKSKQNLTSIKWLSLLKKYRKNGVEVIVLNGIKWLNKKDIKEGLDHKHLPVNTKKYPSKYRKHRYE